MKARLCLGLSLGLWLAAGAGVGCGIQEHPRPPRSGDLPATTPGTGGSAETSPPGGSGGSGGSRDTAPPPPPVNGVDIDGVRVPKEKAIVFIHFGHSNMAGLARSPTELRPFFFDPQPRLWTYQGGGRFVAAKEPTAPDPPNHLGAGPGMGWLRTAAAAAGPDYHFISIGRGRGSAPSPDFMKGGLYWNAFMDRANELKGRVTFGGVFIMLGITERHMPIDQQAAFPDRVAKIIADMRAELGEPNLPVLHTDYETESTGSLGVDSPVGQRLRPLILDLPNKIPNLAIIPTDDLPMRDDHHFDMAGHKLWAERGIKIMIEKGWFRWAK